MSRTILRILAALCLLAATPAFAQTGAAQTGGTRPTAEPVTNAGQVADSVVGEVGQRQTRAQVAEGIKPMARIASRIQNRVQSRINNRIDRGYDPQANATSPFGTAGAQARTAGRPRRGL